VILLANHFLQLLQQKTGGARQLSPESADFLRQYNWPGNIRELRNAMERGIALARENVIKPKDLPGPIQNAATGNTREPVENSPVGTHAGALGDAERQYLASLLEKNSGNVAQSAREAGLSRQGLHKLLKKHGLDAKDYRP
jgi:DNA-binding NtrC family response regulator